MERTTTRTQELEQVRASVESRSEAWPLGYNDSLKAVAGSVNVNWSMVIPLAKYLERKGHLTFSGTGEKNKARMFTPQDLIALQIGVTYLGRDRLNADQNFKKDQAFLDHMHSMGFLQN